MQQKIQIDIIQDHVRSKKGEKKVNKKMSREMMKKMLGRERLYSKQFEGRDDVVRWDVLKIKQEQELELEIIGTNSKYAQGLRLAIDAGDGYIEINGFRTKDIKLMEYDIPRKLRIMCKSEEGFLSVYNIFEREKGKLYSRRSQIDSCGMLVEQNGNTIIYRCNDAGFVTNFDKFVFSITLL